jgi:hypothetical protein
MANLRIFEHYAPPGTVVPILPGTPVAKQQKAIGGASVQATAFGANTTMVHVQAEGICTIEIGAAPVAVVGQGYRLAAGAEQTFSVAPGQILAVISDT